MRSRVSKPPEPIIRDSARAWRVLLILTLGFTVSYVDRQVLNLMVDPIKADLVATDTQISLLQGVAFITAYIAFTPIFGRLTDVSNRKNILAFAVLTWSAFSVLCGLAGSLRALFIARAGVGAAEAALAPAAFSLLSDYFTRERLPRAMSIFLLGPYLGGGIALMLGGLIMRFTAQLAHLVPMLCAYKPWQTTFMVVGALGIPLAATLLALREPPRRIISGAALDERRFSFRETLAFLWQRRGFYVRFFAAMAFTVVVFYAMPAWMPSVLIRNYGVPASSVGIAYGSLILIMGSIGVLAGPLAESWLRKRGYESAVLICIILAALGLAPVCAALLFVGSYKAALVVAALATGLYSFPQPIAASALQVVTPNRLRGVVSSIYVMIISGIGLGVAPTLVAVFTDHVLHNAARVNISLAVVCATSAACASWLGYASLSSFRRAMVMEAQGRSATQPAG